MVVKKLEEGAEEIQLAEGLTISCHGPGYLWFGDDCMSGHYEVTKLISHLQAWVETGSLEVTQSLKGE